jgi:hypothetical protein
MILGIDVDGILANFTKACAALLTSVAGSKRSLPDGFGETIQAPSWYWHKEMGFSDGEMDEVWQEIRRDPHFWVQLEALPMAKDFLSKLRNLGSNHEVYFITDRPGVKPQYQTWWWLSTHGYYEPNVIISRKGKGIVCKALGIETYIDDKPENVEDVWAQSPETTVYMPRYPYNERLHGIEGAVGSLEEFVKRAKLWAS